MNTKPKVVLINPVGFGDPSGSGVNIGLGYLASALLQVGCAVKVLDFENLHADRERRLISALLWEPDLIGVTCTTFSVKNAIHLIQYCKQRYSCFYVAGGPHITMNPDAFMERYRELFDCAVIGEGELTIMELVDVARNRRCLSEVSGIAYYKNDCLVKTERPLIQNLDALPFPNYNTFDSVKGMVKAYPIITERGCPYHCVFCLSSYMWRQHWRPRSPENVVAEIKHAITEYGVKTLSIWDDNFTLPNAFAKDRAERILDLIIAENLGLKIVLPNGVRADSVDEELLQKLKLAGCSFMMVGVEDVGSTTIDKVEKAESRDTIKQAIKQIKAVGIPAECSVVIGLIDSTFATTLESVKFLEDLKIKGHWVIAIPFPNTSLHSWVSTHGRIMLDVNEGLDLCMAMYPPPVVFDTPEFTKDERIEAFKLANIKSGNYSFLFNHTDSAFKIMISLLSVAWKCDKTHFLKHLANTIAIVLYQMERR